MTRFVWLGTLLALAGPAFGQDEGEEEPTGEELQFDDDLFVIKGEVQKPEVVVWISRENLNKGFEVILRESFVDKIVESLYETPF